LKKGKIFFFGRKVHRVYVTGPGSNVRPFRFSSHHISA